MKTKKISWQAIAIVVLALVLIASIALGVSGAWFQDSDKGSSAAKLGNAVELKLQNVGTTTTDGVKGWADLYKSAETAAYPGDKIIGKTQILMGSQTPAIVRAKLVATVKNAEGTAVPVESSTTPTSIAVSDTETVTFSSSDLGAYYDALIKIKDTEAYATKAEEWNKYLLGTMTASLNFAEDAIYGEWVDGASDWKYLSKIYGNQTAAQTSAATIGILQLFDAAYLSQYLTNEVALWDITITLNVEAIQAANLVHVDGDTVTANNEAWYNDMPTALQTLVKTYNTGREKPAA